MAAEFPVSSGRELAPRPVSESVAWSAPGVRVLVAAVVAALAGIALLIRHSAVGGGGVLAGFGADFDAVREPVAGGSVLRAVVADAADAFMPNLDLR